MEFRTEIKLASQQENQIDHQSKVLLLGSCFSENIGQKLSYYKFKISVNPFGILFSPTAIEKVIHDTVNQTTYTTNDLVQSGEIYHSLHHHSEISSMDKDLVIAKIIQGQKSCLEFLKQASHVVITLGTSWVYEYIATKELVANCHKIPQKEFKKRMLSVDEIASSLERTVLLIKKENPSVQIVFTVSPVRHTKDGLVENSRSKAHLLAAIHKIKEGHDVAYFGSYEIMMDDLRDYRFYETDMIHPNEVAIDYIWEQFTKAWIAEKSLGYFKRIMAVQQGLRHRSFHPKSKSHREFLEKLTAKKQLLEEELHVRF